MQALKALVITLGILILIAFGFMVYGVATKFGKEGEERAMPRKQKHVLRVKLLYSQTNAGHVDKGQAGS